MKLILSDETQKKSDEDSIGQNRKATDKNSGSSFPKRRRQPSSSESESNGVEVKNMIFDL